MKDALQEFGVSGLTITEVKGSGRQKAITEHYRGSELAVHLRPKLKVECVVETKDVELVKDVILRHARTGTVGDGKLFILPVEDAVPGAVHHRRATLPDQLTDQVAIGEQ